MSAKRYDICVAETDREGKKRWTKIGAMWPAREGDGFSIKLAALPTSNKDGETWVSAFVPKPRDGERGASAPRQASNANDAAADLDDSIPF